MADSIYTPSCVADCSNELLPAIGNTNCANDDTLEIAEINILHFDEIDSVTGLAKNPITGYVQDDVDATTNEAVILTWRAAHSNVTASKIRTLYGRGEKPEGESTTITLRKNTVYSLAEKQRMIYTIEAMDHKTYNALRKLQKCRGKYAAWFATDQNLYGGGVGIIADIEKVTFPKTGGRGGVSSCIITLSWNDGADPVRDKLPYS